MKEAYAKQLGGQLGKFIKMDVRYPGYLHIRVGYFLTKPLVLSLSVKVKGRGMMSITLRYENVPHLWFTCGRMGHAAMICVVVGSDTGHIQFGEELRVPPPRRTREIKVQQVAVRVIKPLFQVGDQKVESSSKGSQATPSKQHIEGVNNIVANELVHSIKDMHVVKPSQDSSRGEQ
jgi:hypothetical protein